MGRLTEWKISFGSLLFCASLLVGSQAPWVEVRERWEKVGAHLVLGLCSEELGPHFRGTSGWEVILRDNGQRGRK